MEIEPEEIKKQIETAALDLLAVAELKTHDILVLGCSSSEIAGAKIGTAGSEEVAAAVLDGLVPLLQQRGIFFAVQCCEHLNRALVVERACMEYYHLEPVSAIPQRQAGGAVAALGWQRLRQPVLVLSLAAHAGIDIGHTLIGMHLRRVAVPVRSSLKQIGEAPLVMARTRPMLVGGERAQYSKGLEFFH